MPENAARPGFRGTMCGDQVYGNLEAYRWDLSELGFVVRPGAQSPADASTGSLRGAATSAGVTLLRRQPNGEEGPPLSLLPGPSFELI